MITQAHTETAAEGTALNPKYYEGPSEVVGDMRLHQRFFTYRCTAGLVSGKTFNVTFVVDRPVRVVWPYLKDLNCWQNFHGQYYSGVVGDLEGRTFRLSSTAEDAVSGPHHYQVLRVIPEYLIVVSKEVSEKDRAAGIAPDSYVFTLDEHEGRTSIVVLTGRATLAGKDQSEEEALAPWRKMAQASHRKFRDAFIPELKKLVNGHA